MPFDPRVYLTQIRRLINVYESNIGKSWSKKRDRLDTLNTRIQAEFQDILAKFPPEKRQTLAQRERLKNKLEAAYVGWGRQADSIFGLPPVTSADGRKQRTPVAEQTRQAVQLSLGQREATKAGALPTQGLFKKLSETIVENVNDVLRKEFPDQVPTEKQAAKAIADSAGISDQAYIENIAHNLSRMARTHANEMVDRIDSPRPARGASGPEGAVSLFHARAGGSGNEAFIRASHDAHARSVVRDAIVNAHEAATRFAAVDAETGDVLVLTRQQTRTRIVGEQAGAGPATAVYPVPLPNTKQAAEAARRMSDPIAAASLIRKIQPSMRGRRKGKPYVVVMEVEGKDDLQVLRLTSKSFAKEAADYLRDMDDVKSVFLHDTDTFKKHVIPGLGGTGYEYIQ